MTAASAPQSGNADAIPTRPRKPFDRAPRRPAHVPDRHQPRVAVPARVGDLHVAAPHCGDDPGWLFLAAADAQPGQLRQCLEPGQSSSDYFLNTVIIVIPAVIAVLFLASMMAFACTRYSWRFNLTMLMLFTALNLMPPQIIITPLFRMYLNTPVPAPLSDNGHLFDQYLGIALIHIAFQLGFCTFVLSNYMKTISRELNEAALVDGASVWTTYSKVIMPLTKPALAALATLEVTFIYNDFFWALTLMTTGSKLPITTALNNLKGQFFINNNLIAAGAVIVALPTLIVYFVLQKQFIQGLTLGSTKG